MAANRRIKLRNKKTGKTITLQRKKKRKSFMGRKLFAGRSTKTT